MLSTPEQTLKSQLDKALDRIALLEDQIERQGPSKTKKEKHPMPVCFRLTRSEAKVLSALMRFREPTYENIMQELYDVPGDHQRLDDGRILKCFVHHLRKKLIPFDIAIETRWGIGPCLTHENKKKITDILMREMSEMDEFNQSAASGKEAVSEPQ